MQSISDISLLKSESTPLFLAAGFFDGVHRGHQALISRTVEAARKAKGCACVLTFDRHPLAAMAPDLVPPMLCPRARSLKIFERLGVDMTLSLPFTKSLAATTAEDFAKQLFEGMPRHVEFRCGDNWRFGAGGGGNPETLRAMVDPEKISVIVEPFEKDGATEISSTRIRELITDGDIVTANRLLGYAYSFEGMVIQGCGVGGATLNTATANLAPDASLAMPRTGVYATVAELEDGSRFDAVSNFGFCPSFGRKAAMLETHLLNFDGTLYGRALKVFFLRRLRDEIAFDSPSELVKQIKRDIQARLLVNGDNLSAL